MTLAKQVHKNESNEFNLLERISNLENHIFNLQDQMRSLEDKVKAGSDNNRVSIVVLSNDLNKAMSAFTLASKSAALGQEVYMFFTYPGLKLLKKTKLSDQNFFQKAIRSIAIAASHLLGPTIESFDPLGDKLSLNIMKEQIKFLDALITLSMELGVHFIGCIKSMSFPEMSKEDFMIENIDLGNITQFYEDALKSKSSYFI